MAQPPLPCRPLNHADDVAETWDVIVIGSGIGGMACASALSHYGKRCLILEQHYTPGGFTHTFGRKGFTWDVGVHCVGEMTDRSLPGRLLGWLTDRKLHWQPMGDFYERFCFPGDFQIDFPSTKAGFRDALRAKFPAPQDHASIDAYFEAVKTANRAAKPLFASRAMPPWLGDLSLKLSGALGNPYFAKTTAEVLEPIVPNPKLRAVLTAQWGYYGTTPSRSSFLIHALTATHFFYGGFYPVGGARSIAESMLSIVRAAGGETLVRAPVKQILVRNGRATGVEMESGRRFYAKKIVSAAGAHLTVNELLPPEDRQAAWCRRIAAIPQSPPHLCLHLGIEGDIRAAGGTPANQWFMNTWDMEVRDWEVRKPGSEAPVLYMSFPTLKDPDHDPGPEQRHTSEVVTFVPWVDFEKWKGTRRGFRDAEYMEFKKSVEDRMVTQLRKHVPKIMDLAVYKELSTPLSTTHFTHADRGAIYGLEALPDRLTSHDLRARTPIKNLHLAGGDVAILGVTGAMVGGVICAGSILPRTLTHFTSRG